MAFVLCDRFIFNELADVNDSDLRTVDEEPDISPVNRPQYPGNALVPTILTGTQYISKGNRLLNEPDQVRIAMCLFRPHTHNDLLITFTVPVHSDGWSQAKHDFNALVESLKVDSELFATPAEP